MLRCPMSRELLGAIILYVPIAAASAAVWVCVWRLFRIWEGRDVMGQFRPDRRHVNHTERLLRVRPNGEGKR